MGRDMLISVLFDNPVQIHRVKEDASPHDVGRKLFRQRLFYFGHPPILGRSSLPPPTPSHHTSSPSISSLLLPRNLFLCTNVTDAAWAAGMANGVRESILAEARTVEEGGEEDVASAIATLSVKVGVVCCAESR